MRFTGSDTTLGPEMLSTGEVMGRGTNFEEAFLKAQMAVFEDSLDRPYVFIGVMDEDKPKMVVVAKMLEEMGYEILSTRGTFQVLKCHDSSQEEGSRCTPHSPACPSVQPSLFHNFRSSSAIYKIATSVRIFGEFELSASSISCGPECLKTILAFRLHSSPFP